MPKTQKGKKSKKNTQKPKQAKRRTKTSDKPKTSKTKICKNQSSVLERINKLERKVFKKKSSNKKTKKSVNRKSVISKDRIKPITVIEEEIF